MKQFASFLLVASVALASPPPSSKKISALIIPLDKESERLTLQLETYANNALGEFDGFTVRSSDDLFGVGIDEESVASLKRADRGFAESKSSFDAREYEDAERKLRATIKEYSKAVSALKGCGNLCESIAMFGAVLQARGDAEEAKLVLLDLISLSPTYELDRKRYPQNFLSLKAQVATSRNAQIRGNIDVKTKPAGARIFLNGEMQGYSPMTLQTLPIGKAMLKIERPGFKQVGLVVEVGTETQEIKQELVASSGYKAYDDILDKLAGETLKDKGGQSMLSVGNSLKIERAIIGVVKEAADTGRTELAVGYYELKTGKRLAFRRGAFQGDEFGQIKTETARMVNRLINDSEGGDAEKATKAGGDPLEHKAGTEDWNSEDKGGRNTRKKNKSGDPLENSSGTEDW
jgi:hypothetical protein